MEGEKIGPSFFLDSRVVFFYSHSSKILSAHFSAAERKGNQLNKSGQSVKRFSDMSDDIPVVSDVDGYVVI